jgi:hypothetical protein
MTTTSRFCCISSRSCRNHSRIRRLTRLRTTAFPTRRLTAIPSRVRPSPPCSTRSLTRIIKLPTRIRRPYRRTYANSSDRTRRSARSNGPVWIPTATSMLLSQQAAGAPYRAAASRWRDPLDSSSDSETRVHAADELDSADMCASSLLPFGESCIRTPAEHSKVATPLYRVNASRASLVGLLHALIPWHTIHPDHGRICSGERSTVAAHPVQPLSPRYRQA